MDRPTRRRGFTLIEMLVVVAIIGVLASIGLPLAELAHRRTQEAELRSALRQIRNALDAYKRNSDEGHITRLADGSGYPTSLRELTEGIEDQRSPNKQKIYLLRRLPRDPFASVDIVDAAETWRLRSYESPPDQPAPGRDIFDVHSSSEKQALDGTDYAKW